MPAGRLSARLASQPPGYAFTLGRVLVVYVALTLTVFLSALDQAIVATAGVAVISDIGGIDTYAWIFTGYLLASTVTIPLWGRLGDAMGKKRPLMLAVGLFLVGSALCAVATSMPELVVFRVLQGAGAGGLLPLTHATIGAIVPLRERGRFVGLILGSFAAGSVAGPLIGGFLVDAFGWRSVFVVNLPIGLVALAVLQSSMAVPARVRSLRTIDWTGAALVTGVSSLALYLLWDLGRAGSGTTVLVGLCALVPLGVVLVLREVREEEPVLPLRLFRHGIVVASVLGIATSGAVMFLCIAELPFFVQSITQGSATSAGVALIPLLLAMTAGGVLSGRLTMRFGRTRPIAVAGTAVATVGLVVLAHIPDAAGPGDVVLGSVLVGLGIAAGNQVYVVACQSVVPREQIGAATALAHFGRAMGQALGVTLVGVLLARAVAGAAGAHDLGGISLSAVERADVADALRLGFWIAAGIQAAAFLLVLALLEEVRWRSPAAAGAEGS